MGGRLTVAIASSLVIADTARNATTNTTAALTPVVTIQRFARTHWCALFTVIRALVDTPRRLPLPTQSASRDRRHRVIRYTGGALFGKARHSTQRGAHAELRNAHRSP